MIDLARWLPLAPPDLSIQLRQVMTSDLVISLRALPVGVLETRIQFDGRRKVDDRGVWVFDFEIKERASAAKRGLVGLNLNRAITVVDGLLKVAVLLGEPREIGECDRVGRRFARRRLVILLGLVIFADFKLSDAAIVIRVGVAATLFNGIRKARNGPRVLLQLVVNQQGIGFFEQIHDLASRSSLTDPPRTPAEFYHKQLAARKKRAG